MASNTDSSFITSLVEDNKKSQPDASGLPGLVPRPKPQNSWEGYTLRMLKVSLDDPDQKAELESIMNRAVTSSSPEVLIPSIDKFTFNSEYFVVITYLEKNR